MLFTYNCSFTSIFADILMIPNTTSKKGTHQFKFNKLNAKMTSTKNINSTKKCKNRKILIYETLISE